MHVGALCDQHATSEMSRAYAEGPEGTPKRHGVRSQHFLRRNIKEYKRVIVTLQYDALILLDVP